MNRLLLHPLKTTNTFSFIFLYFYFNKTKHQNVVYFILMKKICTFSKSFDVNKS